ncbi:hypothetical protein D3C85_1564910 [compost metagenome]
MEYELQTLKTSAGAELEYNMRAARFSEDLASLGVSAKLTRSCWMVMCERIPACAEILDKLNNERSARRLIMFSRPLFLLF